jgi:uncharacterized membrane protein
LDLISIDVRRLTLKKNQNYKVKSYIENMKKEKKKQKTSLNLEENVEGALCYIFGWISGIIIFLLEKESKFVRFHALQSTITFLGLTIASIFFNIIPFFGWIISSLIGLLGFALWIVLMIKAYQGEMYTLPIAGDIAKQYLK